ncbi:hypothetical protein JB92DRAFT_3009571, partial [Gautieria morchelliformis]
VFPMLTSPKFVSLSALPPPSLTRFPSLHPPHPRVFTNTYTTSPTHSVAHSPPLNRISHPNPASLSSHEILANIHRARDKEG